MSTHRDIASRLSGPLVQHGRESATSDGTTANISVTFPTAFSSTPTVVATPQVGSNTQRTGLLVAVSTTGFTIRMTNNDALDTGTTYTINWIAMGDA